MHTTISEWLSTWLSTLELYCGAETIGMVWLCKAVTGELVKVQDSPELATAFFSPRYKRFCYTNKIIC